MNNRRTIDKIASIIAGIAIWVYVISVLDPVTTGTIKAVPVHLVNTEIMQSSGLAIAGSGEYTVDIVVGGNRSNVSSATASDFIAEADVSELHKGQNYITVEVKAPSNLSVSEIRTQNIQVYVDTAVSVDKELRIFTANIPEGHELGAIEVETSSISVSGAKSLVDAVADVQATIDAAGMAIDEPASGNVALIPVDADGKRVYGVALSRDSVKIQSTLYATKEVALNVPLEGDIDERVTLLSEIVPSSVVIKGPSSVLSSVWKIDAEPIDRSAISESCSIPVSMILPDDTELAHDYRKLSVEYEIKGRVTKTLTITDSNVQFVNVTPGLTVRLPADLELSFSVFDDVESLLSTGKLIFVVDMTDIPEGEHDAPFTIVYDDVLEGTYLIDEPETIRVLVESEP